ncbi:hypothetical protein BH11CYA1_BH11CYA1_48290 [soil metagenome]
MPTAQAQDNLSDRAENSPVDQVKAQAESESRKVESVDYWAAIGGGLEGIEEVDLEIDCSRDHRLGIVSEAILRTAIESRCKAAGLKFVRSKSNSPILTVHLISANDGGRLCSIYIDVAVPLAPDKNNVPMVCNKWSGGSKESGLEFKHDSTSCVLKAIDEFLKSWKALNPR